MIQVVCSNCGIRILVPVTVQGRSGVCFGCGTPIHVPNSPKVLQDQDLAFSPGAKISDRYVIQERIGHGGMGVVYRAIDALVNEEVALKIMKPHLLKTQKGQRDFIQEAQIARRLRHENIVAVHDVSWTDDGLLYITMEFLRGQSLRAMLRRHRQERRLVDVRVCVEFVSQVLAAFEYAHRTVVHRDLKPENVMVLPGERIKVLDFGLARAVDEEAAYRPGQDPNRVVGTWAYAAPEQKRHHQVDLRTDIYAVGLILHEMLTLRTPLDEPISVNQARSDVSPSLLAVHDRALAQLPEERWQSAGEFRRNLLEAFDRSYRITFVPDSDLPTGQTVSTEGMAFLEGGSFLIGCNEFPEESPEFEVHIEPFYMDRYPVTVGEYAKFIEATGRPTPKYWHGAQFSGLSQPVVGVSWHDANAYAAWVGKKLPTEAQWEFAARGRANRKYPWGNTEPDTTHCNFGDYLGMPSIVTMHEEGMTPEGICDLAGNVYEWTRDAFSPYAQNGGVGGDAPQIAVRGGCWSSPPHELRCTHRRGVFPETQLPTVGFRCVLPAHAVPERK